MVLKEGFSWEEVDDVGKRRDNWECKDWVIESRKDLKNRWKD